MKYEYNFLIPVYLQPIVTLDMNSVVSNNLSLKYQSFTTNGVREILSVMHLINSFKGILHYLEKKEKCKKKTEGELECMKNINSRLWSIVCNPVYLDKTLHSGLKSSSIVSYPSNGSL